MLGPKSLGAAVTTLGGGEVVRVMQRRQGCVAFDPPFGSRINSKQSPPERRGHTRPLPVWLGHLMVSRLETARQISVSTKPAAGDRASPRMGGRSAFPLMLSAVGPADRWDEALDKRNEVTLSRYTHLGKDVLAMCPGGRLADL